MIWRGVSRKSLILADAPIFVSDLKQMWQAGGDSEARFKLGHNASEASANVNRPWGEESTRDRTARRWFGKFRSGDESLKDEEGRGRLGSLENEQLHAVVEQNPRQSVREMSQTLGVGIATVSHHLKIIGKVKKLDKWVPHELNENQKLRRFEVCSMLSLRNTNDPFLDQIVTCDEKWVLCDNRIRSGQWLDRDEPPQTLPKANVAPEKDYGDCLVVCNRCYSLQLFRSQ
ncbi:hypothetical protein FHG87_021634 [Trinorchestia longiramus]|nr:hypothetical protein FHG87_021634 [Trinorchestia longiramus]